VASTPAASATLHLRVTDDSGCHSAPLTLHYLRTRSTRAFALPARWFWRIHVASSRMCIPHSFSFFPGFRQVLFYTKTLFSFSLNPHGFHQVCSPPTRTAYCFKIEESHTAFCPRLGSQHYVDHHSCTRTAFAGRESLKKHWPGLFVTHALLRNTIIWPEGSASRCLFSGHL
jgi:hypothetical protein